MSKAENNEQIDADIQQCKADILRANDIMPPYDKKAKSPQNEQEPSSKDITEKAAEENPTATEEEPILLRSEEKEAISLDDTSPIPIKTIHHKKTAPPPATAEKLKKTETTKAPQGQGQIPKFDLAEDIMAEQRKITAIRRKAPGRKTEPQKIDVQAEPVGYTIEQPTSALSEQDQIIVEIVARDIERLCRGQDFKNTTNRGTKGNTPL